MIKLLYLLMAIVAIVLLYFGIKLLLEYYALKKHKITKTVTITLDEVGRYSIILNRKRIKMDIKIVSLNDYEVAIKDINNNNIDINRSSIFTLNQGTKGFGEHYMHYGNFEINVESQRTLNISFANKNQEIEKAYLEIKKSSPKMKYGILCLIASFILLFASLFMYLILEGKMK
jgi:hypothetical protein